MDKILALTFILVLQPGFAYVFYFAMDKVLSLVSIENNVIVLITSHILYSIFAFLFARGFLSSKEAKKLGFK